MNINTTSPRGQVYIRYNLGNGGNLVYGREFVRAEGRSILRGITIDASSCPDLVPAAAVLGSLSCETTKIVNAKRLRIKESDRLAAISIGLNKLGAKISELPDGLIIVGQETLKGGVVDSRDDHRIAMAFAIASIRCRSLLL